MVRTRAQIILELLGQRGSVTVQELSDQLGVSTVTIRKDLTELEANSLVVRKRGSASLPTFRQQPYMPQRIRQEMQGNDKRRIAERAASLVEPGDSIILDSGSTTLMIAEELKRHSFASIATNSISIAHQLADSDHALTLAGGQMLNHSMCTAGPAAEAFFRSIRATKLFLGTTGIRDTMELTTGLMAEVGVKAAMIEAAEQVILVADAQKFRRNSMFSFCTPDRLDCIITSSSELPEGMRDIIRANHIELICVDR